MPVVPEDDVTPPRTLRIGLLQCGHIHPDLVPEHGDYPELFAQLLGAHGIELTTYDVVDGPTPDRTDECDGWLVSGSADSVYDDLPWIAPVASFLRRILDDGAPLVAVCFGHQLLARALGVEVARADAGWGAGAHDYELVDARPWMDPPATGGTVRLLASHQDQVRELPPGATLLARTAHCPIAAYELGTALAIQPHPEFTREISAGLVERRRERIGAPTADRALASLDRPTDDELVGRWMATFLHRAAASR